MADYADWKENLQGDLKDIGVTDIKMNERQSISIPDFSGSILQFKGNFASKKYTPDLRAYPSGLSLALAHYEVKKVGFRASDQVVEISQITFSWTYSTICLCIFKYYFHQLWLLCNDER